MVGSGCLPEGDGNEDGGEVNPHVKTLIGEGSGGLGESDTIEAMEESNKNPSSWAAGMDIVDCLPLALRSDSLGEDKLLLIGSILGITSLQRKSRLKDILQDFFESEWNNIEEDQWLRRRRKQERELQNLHSNVNYDHTMVLAGSGAQRSD